MKLHNHELLRFLLTLLYKGDYLYTYSTLSLPSPSWCWNFQTNKRWAMSVVTDSSVLASTLQRPFLLHGLVPTLGAGAGAWNTHGYKCKLQFYNSYLKLKSCSQNNNQIITRYWSATKIDFISFWLYGNMNEILNSALNFDKRKANINHIWKILLSKNTCLICVLTKIFWK